MASSLARLPHLRRQRQETTESCPELRRIRRTMRRRREERTEQRRERRIREAREAAERAERARCERLGRRLTQMAAANPVAPPLGPDDRPDLLLGALKAGATLHPGDAAAEAVKRQEWRDWMVSHSILPESRISARERRRLRRIFDMIDADGSNSIEQDEIESAMRFIGIEVDRGELVQRLKMLDPSYDGSISFTEFARGMSTMDEWDMLLRARRQRLARTRCMLARSQRSLRRAKSERAPAETIERHRSQVQLLQGRIDDPMCAAEVPFSLWLPAFQRLRLIRGVSAEGSAFLASFEDRRAYRRWGEPADSDDDVDEEEIAAESARAREASSKGGEAGADGGEAGEAGAPAGDGSAPPGPKTPKLTRLPTRRARNVRVVVTGEGGGPAVELPLSGTCRNESTTGADGSLLLTAHWARTLDEVRNRSALTKRRST